MGLLQDLAKNTSRVAYLPGLHRLAVGTEDGYIQVYDVKSFSKILV